MDPNLNPPVSNVIFRDTKHPHPPLVSILRGFSTNRDSFESERNLGQTGNSYYSALSRYDSGLLSAALEFPQQHKALTYHTEGKKSRSSWAHRNKAVKVPLLKWRWQSVHSNIYFVICPSQQTIIRLPWVRFFLERSHNGIRCCLEKTIPAPCFLIRSIFHFSFTKSSTICNYSTVIIPHTNQGTKHMTTN